MIRLLPGPLRRVWTLLCAGTVVGSYTDTCERSFVPGDMLRDDENFRRKVLTVLSTRDLVLGVGSPDIAAQPG